MLGFRRTSDVDCAALLTALDRSIAMVTFDTSGKVLAANENFCRAMGYELAELIGQHHRIFVDPEYANSPEYQEFWRKLGSGDFEAKEYRRLGKGGREVWIQASYNPVRDQRGRVAKVVKLATDVTEARRRKADSDAAAAETSGMMTIEFTPKGDIVSASPLFLKASGYALEEIRGRHHRLFVTKDYAQSAEYAEFWQRLARGEFVAGDYQRFGKDGKEVWLQASYNPIVDSSGRVTGVVKHAIDITGRIHAVMALGAGLAELAANNLGHRINERLDPNFEKLRVDYNSAATQLHDVIAGISSNTHEIRSAIGDIAQASDDLSARTEQQAASLEQTAAALQEITNTVRSTAASAGQAGEAVAKARAKADESGRVVQEAVAAMSKIEDSAKQITQIIGVIDEIAFQTNLLALNAGVEAARAGDAGRGFAVVASEVRALAQRSADAAKEIKALISASSQQVGHGVGLVGETGRALNQIAEQVVGIDGIVVQITSTAQEQATGLAEVNTAVNQMDKVTQQNAAMVEQSTAATHAMVNETEKLAGLASQFRLLDNAVAKRAAPARPQRPAPAKHPVVRPTARAIERGNAAVARDEWEEF